MCLHPAEPPPAITVEGNVTASPGSRAVLTCHVVSTVNFNLTWLRGGHDASLDPRVHVLSNLSLQVSSVTPDQSGWYECVAINEGGVKAEQIYLTVQGEECVFTLVCVLWSDVDTEKHFFLQICRSTLLFVVYMYMCCIIFGMCECFFSVILHCGKTNPFTKYMGPRPPRFPIIQPILYGTCEYYLHLMLGQHLSRVFHFWTALKL